MLTNFTALINKIDCDYGTDQQLKFIDEYNMSLEERISIYEKIRDNQEDILNQLESQINNSGYDFENRLSIWRRDVQLTLRCLAASVLFNDLDRLKNGFLIWHQTIVRANHVTNISSLTYETLKVVLENHLTSKEIKLVIPALNSAQSVLGF